ncbi:MAG: ATPase, partial [Meiothermus sp.]
LSYEALADEIKLEDIVSKIIAAVPLPKVHLGDPYRDTRPTENPAA